MTNFTKLPQKFEKKIGSILTQAEIDELYAVSKSAGLFLTKSGGNVKITCQQMNKCSLSYFKAH